jgi:hypothetical protein
MLLKKMKQQFLSRKFRKELKKTPDARTPTLKRIHSIAILTTDDFFSELDLVNELKRHFKSVKNVHVYYFRKFQKTDVIEIPYFTEKDVNWQGKIKNVDLENFLETPFDLLIGYFNTKQLYLEFTVLKSNATFKVGFANVNDQIYDLVVNENPKNSTACIKVIKKYVELLHKI